MDVNHSGIVPRLASRVIAFLCALSVATAGGAACAGWHLTPEGRLACCIEGSGCPTHQTKSAGGESRMIAQADADRCCAASEEDSSSTPKASAARLITNIAGAAVVVILPSSPARLWRYGRVRRSRRYRVGHHAGCDPGKTRTRRQAASPDDVHGRHDERLSRALPGDDKVARSTRENHCRREGLEGRQPDAVGPRTDGKAAGQYA